MTQSDTKGKTVSPKNVAINQNISLLSTTPEAGSQGMENDKDSGSESAASILFAELISPELSGQIHVIPAELVGLQVVTLPMRSARKRFAALPFAVEESLGQGIDDAHLALCGEGTASGEVLAAVVATEIMAGITNSHPAQAIVAEQMLLAAPEQPETGACLWHCYRNGGRVLVRVSDGTGFAARSEMLLTLWQTAGKPPVKSYGTPLPDEIGSTHDYGDPPLASSEGLTDLRQGPFRPDLGLDRPVKWLAAACALAAVAHLGIAAADLRAQKELADSLQITAQSALDQRLPDTTTDTPPATVQRMLQAQSKPNRGSDFLPLLNRVSAALLGQSEAVQVRQLNWSENTLKLSLEAPDLDALQQAEARLVSDGLAVSSGSAMAEAGAARADLTVRQ